MRAPRFGLLLLYLTVAACSSIGLYPEQFACHTEDEILLPFLVSDTSITPAITCTERVAEPRVSLSKAPTPETILFSIHTNDVKLDLEIPLPLDLLLSLHQTTPREVHQVLRQLRLSSPTSEVLDESNSGEACVTLAFEATSFRVSVCGPSLEPSSSSHRLEAREAQACCNSSNATIVGSCDCGSDPFVLNVQKDVFVDSCNITAGSIEVVTTGTVTFLSSDFVMQAAGDNTWTAQGFADAGGGLGRRIRSESGTLTLRADGSLSLGSLLLRGGDVVLSSTTGGSDAVTLASTYVLWSRSFNVTGQSIDGHGIAFERTTLDSQGSGTMFLNGTSTNGRGVFLNTSSVPGPVSSVMYGATNRTVAVLLDRWDLIQAEVDASCFGTGECTGIQTLGLHNIRQSTLTAVGTGNTMAIQMDASTSIVGESVIRGRHPCSGVTVGAAVSVLDGASLSLDGVAEGPCSGEAVGLHIKSAVSLQASASVDARGSVGSAQSEAVGLLIEGTITSDADSSSAWTGEALYTSVAGATGVDVRSGGFLGAGQNTTLEGSSRGDGQGIGVSCGVGTTIEYMSISGYVESVYLDGATGIRAITAEGNQFTEANLTGLVVPSSTGDASVWGIDLIDSRLASCHLNGTVTSASPVVRGVEIRDSSTTNSVIYGEVHDGDDIVSTLVANSSFDMSTINGQAFASGGTTVNGVRLEESTITGSDLIISGGVQLEGSAPSIGIYCNRTTFQGTAITFQGTVSDPYNSSTAVGGTFDNVHWNNSITTITAMGPTGAEFTGGLLLSANLTFVSVALTVTVLPGDLTISSREFSLRAENSGSGPALMMNALLNPIGTPCNLVFDGVAAAGDAIVYGSSALDLGSCTADFTAPVRVPGDLEVTGSKNAKVQFAALSGATNIDFQLNGTTEIYNGTDVAGSLRWTGVNSYCLLNGIITSPLIVLCSKMTTEGATVTADSLQANFINCEANPNCDIYLRSTNQLSLATHIGNILRPATLELQGANIYCTSSASLYVSSGLMVNGPLVILDAMRVHGAATVNQVTFNQSVDITTSLEFFGDSVWYSVDFLGPITNSTANSVVRFNGNYVTFNDRVDVNVDLTGSVASSQSIYSLLANDVEIRPPSMDVRVTGSELMVSSLQNNRSDPIDIAFDISLGNTQYSRLYVEQILSGPLRLQFSGTANSLAVYYLMTWDVSSASISCAAQNGTQVQVNEGSLCAMEGGIYTLSATYLQAPPASMNYGSRNLAFMGNAIPVAVDDTASNVCTVGQSCNNCVDVLLNDFDQEGDSLTVAMTALSGGVLWNLSGSTVCGGPPSMPEHELTWMATYQVSDSKGAVSNNATVTFYYRLPPDPCCTVEGTNVTLTGVCNCTGTTFSVHVNGTLTIINYNVTADLIEIEADNVIFTSTSYLQSRTNLTISGQQIVSENAVDWHLACNNTLSLTTLSGPIALALGSLSGGDIKLNAQHPGTGDAVSLLSMSFLWEEQLSVIGTSSGGRGVVMTAPQFTALQYAWLHVQGSGSNNGTELHGPFTGSFLQQTIQGVSKQGFAVVVDSWELKYATVNAVCSNSSAPCTGLYTTGITDMTGVWILTTGGTPGQAALLEADMSIIGPCQISATGQCGGINLLGSVTLEPGANLTMNGDSSGTCSTEISVGIEVNGPITLSAGSTVQASGSVHGALREAAGLRIRKNITSTPASISTWKGTVTGLAALGGRGVDIIGGGFIGRGSSTILEGRSNVNPAGIGIFCKNVGSRLEYVTANGYIDNTNNTASAGIVVNVGSESTVIVGSNLFANVTNSGISAPSVTPTFGIMLTQATLSNSSVVAIMTSHVPLARAIKLNATESENTSFDGSAYSGQDIAGVFMEGGNVFRNCSVTGSLVGIPPTGLVNDSMSGVRIKDYLNVSSTSVNGQVYRSENYATVSVMCDSAVIVGSYISLHGSSRNGSSRGVELVNSTITTDYTNLVGSGGQGVVFTGNNVLQSTSLTCDSDGVNATILPSSLTISTGQGQFSGDSDDEHALIIRAQFVNPSGCTHHFNGTTSAGTEPILLKPISGDLDLGSCAFYFDSPQAVRVPGNLNVTGGDISAIQFNQLVVEGSATFNNLGETRVTSSLTVQGPLSWTSSSSSCVLNGYIQAYDNATFCSLMHTEGVTINGTALNFGAINWMTSAGSGAVRALATSEITFNADIGSEVPVPWLVADAPMVNVRGPRVFNVSETFDTSNVITDSSWVIGAGENSQNAFFRGSVSLAAELLLENYRNIDFYGTVLPQSEASILHIRNSSVIHCREDVQVQGRYEGNLQSQKSLDRVVTDGDLQITPVDANITLPDSELLISALERGLAGDALSFTLYAPSREQYGRLYVEDMSAITEPIDVNFFGSLVQGYTYHVFTWDGAFDAPQLLRCPIYPTTSMGFIEEGTTCNGYAGTVLVATYLTPPPSYMNYGDNYLALRVNSHPAAINDAVTRECTRSTNCTVCVDVLANDVDPDGDALASIGLASDVGVYGEHWYVVDNVTLCVDASTLDSDSQLVNQYQTYDVYGSNSNHATVNITLIFVAPSTTMTASASASRSISPTPTSSPTATPTPSSSSASSPSRTASITATTSITPTPSSSITLSSSSSRSYSSSRTASSTSTTSSTQSTTPSATATSSATSSASLTPTGTGSSTSSASSTISLSSSSSVTPTPSSSISISSSSTQSTTPSATATSSATSSASLTPTGTGSSTSSVSLSSSQSPSSTASVTNTPSSSITLSSSSSRTDTPSRTSSPTSSSTSSDSRTATPTGSNSPSASPTVSATTSVTPTRSPTPSLSRSPSPSVTTSRTPTGTSTSSDSPSRSRTGSSSSSPTSSTSATPSGTPSPSASSTASPSGSSSVSHSASSSDNHSVSARPSLNPSALVGAGEQASVSSMPSHSSSGRASASGTPSPSVVPDVVDESTMQNLAQCQTCEYKQTSVALSGEDQRVELSGDDGGPVVTLSIPASLAAQGATAEVQVQYARDLDSQGDASAMKSAVVDIVLMVDGQMITKLSEPLEICLAYSDPLARSIPTSDLCLAFYDVERQAWACEDMGLEANGVGQLCGDTPHLTSFALLLGGDTGSSGEYFPQSTIAWLSLGFIAGALVVILLALVAIEIRYQRKRSVEGRNFRALGTRIEAMSK